MTVAFELFGREFVGLNGGSNKLADGGQEIACGWVTDRYGAAWQIVPRRLRELLSDPDRDRAQRAMAAMLEMKKIEVAELERAAAAA